MNRILRVTRLFLFVAILPATPLSAQDDHTLLVDVLYGHKDGLALTFDVVFPERPNGAGVLYMVSAGWFSRWLPADEIVDRLDLAPLLSGGFTVFVVRHGSAPRYKVPDAVSDVRKAVAHIRTNAADFRVDPDRLGVFGGSAGGHLSLMLGLASDAESGHAQSRVAAVVAYFPPVDLRDFVGPSERFPALDFEPSVAPSVSPILFASADDPPTLLVHGTADDLVPLAHSRQMHDALARARVVTELVVIDGGTHGFRGEHRRRASEAMLDWFTTHLAR